MHVQPYLMFEGRCEEAFEFYRTAIDAKLERKLYFKDNPDPNMGPHDHPEKVMHMSFKVGDSTFMASDGRCLGKAKFEGFALSLLVADAAQVAKYFNALAAGGQVQMPLAKTFFSPMFGMVADKFGVTWMVLAQQ